MVTWILILIASGSGANSQSVDHIEFHTKEGCESAAKYMADQNIRGTGRVMTWCVPNEKPLDTNSAESEAPKGE